MTYQPEHQHPAYQHHQPPPGYAYPPPQPPQPPAPKKPRWLIVGLSGVAAAILSAVTITVLLADNRDDDEPGPDQDGVFELPVSEETELEAAEAGCAPNNPYIQIGDNGRSMDIQTLDADAILLAELGEEDPTATGATLEEVGCILDRLGTPDSVIARMDSTRALDGMQDATWDGYSAVWTYHPDDGLNLIIEQTP